MRLPAGDVAARVVSSLRIVVVGPGVAGLAAAAALLRDAPTADVLVLEARGRVGGLVETERTSDGFVIEHGADCLVTANSWGIAAVEAAGLGGAIVVGAGPRRAYVATPGGLVPMPAMFAGVTPATMLAMLRTPLLKRREACGVRWCCGHGRC